MPTPEGLSARGSALWESLGQTEGTPAGVLALEACRTADTLDELNAIAGGKGVLDLLRFRLKDDSGRVAEVKFDAVLGEIRQQQNGLRQMLVSLGMKPGAGAAEKPKGSKLDEFTARRQKRDGAGPAKPDTASTTRERAASRRRR